MLEVSTSIGEKTMSSVKVINLEIEDSKDICCMTYYVAKNILFVNFKNQTYYRYNDVPISHIMSIINNNMASVGRYFHAFIKNEYKFELVAGTVEDFFTYLQSQGL